jgi:4-amino-4-deoxy-L-arabinose transferase-like glycosyltransferase
MEKLKAISLNGRYVLMAFFLVFGVFFSLHLVRQPVIDWDEKVYLHLSKQMTWNLEGYTTQNSHIDQQLPQACYRSPLFHHPPLVPLGIKLLSFAGFLVGAKILNLILWGTSIFLVYAIACKFTDLKGALLALVLWVMCPIVNLEARLVHLDFPSTVLTLSGFWFFLKFQDHVPKRIYLVGSGVAFALAMLTKYTGPLLVSLPVFLFITNRERLRDWKAWVIYGGTISFGFVWWLYFFVRFGSIIPPGFDGEEINRHVTPYLNSISKRQWYDLWVYFLAICPLLLIYLGGVGKALFDKVGRRKTLPAVSDRIRSLIAANAGIWVFVLLFSLINSQTNGYWVFRHIMPVFPIIYISIGVIFSQILDRDQETINSFLIALVLLTLVTMISSTTLTGFEVRNLKPIPVSLFWFQMGHLFH